MGNSGQSDQDVEVAAVHIHEQGEQNQDHDVGTRVGDDRRDTHPKHTVEDSQVVGGQSSRNSRPKKDFRIVKKRGRISDGLVQRRLDSFIVAFPNLPGGRGGKNIFLSCNPVL